VLEITEREAIEDLGRLRENLERCRAEGIRIAADDVGAGNAGLRLLSEIRFDIVKVDLSLVQRGALRDSALAVLRAIRDIGHQSGAMVVAEGIESADQLEVVRALDLVAGQGYLLGMPADEIDAESLDLDSLLAAHEARLRSLGGFLDLWSTDDRPAPRPTPDVAPPTEPEAALIAATEAFAQELPLGAQASATVAAASAPASARSRPRRRRSTEDAA
jgi:hypothetical protein